MKSFQYVSPRSVDSAVSLVADQGRFLAGGIDILGEMKDYIANPRLLVNIKEISGLNGIVPPHGARAHMEASDVWTIGTNVTVSEIEQHSELKRVFPGLQQAAAEVGSPQIRNVATLGGNLAQHSRCWYYRHRDIRCLKRGGDTCYAHDGENKYHSLFSGNPCISPVVSNLAIALSALDARVVVRRGKEEASLSIADLYVRAWDNPEAHNSLTGTDLILRVQIPDAGYRSAYQQVSEKASFDWALVSCAATAKVDGAKLSKARVVLGAVAPIPWQVQAAHDFLEGKKLDDDVANHAAEIILKDAVPREHNGYKLPIAQALIRRTLKQLVA